MDSENGIRYCQVGVVIVRLGCKTLRYETEATEG